VRPHGSCDTHALEDLLRRAAQVAVQGGMDAQAMRAIVEDVVAQSEPLLPPPSLTPMPGVRTAGSLVQQTYTTLRAAHELHATLLASITQSVLAASAPAQETRSSRQLDPDTANAADRLLGLRDAEKLVATLVEPPASNDMAADEQERDLAQHITCAVVAATAFDAGATYEDFLGAQLCTFLPERMKVDAPRAQAAWRKTVAVTSNAKREGRSNIGILHTYLAPPHNHDKPQQVQHMHYVFPLRECVHVDRC